MKLIRVIIHIIIGIATYQCFSQTNQTPSLFGGVEEMLHAVSGSTNWTVVGGWGRATTGKRNIIFYDFAYAFNENVGLIVGGDYLYEKGERQFNTVKGGITLHAKIKPFEFTGIPYLSNMDGTPFVSALICTPRGKQYIGEITTAGLNLELLKFSKFTLDVGAQYENRVGQGRWNGNYILGHIGISRVF